MVYIEYNFLLLWGDEMKVLLPSEFHGELAYALTCQYDDFCGCSELVFKFVNNHDCHPTGLLLLSSFLRRVNETVKNTEYDIYNELNYLSSMGFYRSIDLDVGKEISKLKAQKNFIPIRKLDLRKNCKEGIDPYTLIDSTAKEMCEVVSSADESLYETLFYSIVEILRNVYDHSQKQVLWYAAQYWPVLGVVEVSILDEGIGIKKSLSQKYKALETHEEAIKTATEKGVTRSRKKPSGLDDYENTGYGLYKIRQIAEIAGHLIVCSGDKVVEYAEDEIITYDCVHQGTVIGLRLYVDKLEENNEKLRKILKPGRA